MEEYAAEIGAVTFPVNRKTVETLVSAASQRLRTVSVHAAHQRTYQES